MDKYIIGLSATPQKTGLTPTPRNILEIPSEESEVINPREPWPYLKEFFKTKPGKDDKTYTATCEKCKPDKRTIQIYLSSLSNIRRHYETNHLHLLSNLKEAIMLGSRRGVKRKIPPYDVAISDSPNKKQTTIGAWASSARLPSQQHCNKLFLSMMIRLASSSYLRAWTHALNPDRAMPPARTTVTRQIKDLYHDNVQELIIHLGKVDYIATTADCWTSKSNRMDYMGMTGHWLAIENDCVVRKSAVLVCKQVTGSLTHNVLANEINAVHNKFNIEAKCVSTTTDNGRNFVKVGYI